MMVSLIPGYSSAHCMISHQPLSYLSPSRFFPVVFVISPPKREHPLRSKRKQVKPKKEDRLLSEFSDCSEVVGMSKGWEVEGDSALESEVLEIMKNSKNPDQFPSKRELLEAGRGDLVEAILKRGGWMSIGWEDDEEVTESEKTENGLARNSQFEFQTDGNSVCEVGGTSGSELNEEGKYIEGTFFLGNPSPASLYSDRSLETAAEDEGGIEGILNRLERQRSLSFGMKKRKDSGINVDKDSCLPERSGLLLLGHDRPPFHSNGSVSSHADAVSSSSLKKDAWRTWSVQRAGFSNMEFEAAEIDFRRSTHGRTENKYIDDISAVTADAKEPVDQRKELNSCDGAQITQGDVTSRIQHLQMELSSTLCSFRSKPSDLAEKAKEYLSEDLRELSDAFEFQENEIMDSQSRLRSLRAKLAVLEGKMTLAILDAHKILDDKQKRIDNARRALQLLRTTCVVWPNPGSEVFLAGSYDGWATQRMMERSRTGIFSLQLKLYPGTYEIKFIVDGSWKVDPLRPVVNNNGYENNLLVIT